MNTKKLLIASGLVIAVLVIGGAIFLATFDVNKLRPTIQSGLEQQLHRPVTLGNMSLGLFPLSIRVNDVKVGENSAFPTGQPFATVKEIRVRAELLPLLRKDIRVDSLELEQPQIELVSNASGAWNYSDLTSGGSKGGGSSTAVSSVQITDGSLTLANLARPSSRTRYDHVDIALTDFAPGKTFHLKMSAQLPGANRDSVMLEGSGGPVNGPATPFNGHVTIAGAPAGALGKFTGATLPVDGIVSGAADIRSAASVMEIKGKLAVDRASVHGAALGVPMAFDFDLTDDSRSGMIQTRIAKITAGSVVVDTSAQINSLTNVFTASARTQNANVAELAALGRAVGAGNISGSGTVSFDLTASGALSGPVNYVGRASIPDARISTGGAGGPTILHNATVQFNKDNAPIVAERLSTQGLTLNNLHTTAVLNRGVVTLSPLSAGLFGGSVSGTIVADANPDPQALALDLKLQSVDANQLLSATSSLKNTIYGSLSASTNLKLRLYSAEVELARSMNGTVALNLVNGRVATVNTMNELASIAKFVGYSVNPQGATQIRRLSGDLNITDGVAHTNNLTLVMQEGSLAAAGTMNLADQTLNLKTTAVIDRGTSARVGGNKAGGFMQTVVANGNGELVIPAIVTGSFAHPHFAPDLEQMAQLKLKSVVPGLTSQGKALGGLLGGSKQNGAQQQQIQNAVGGALDSIFNRKKKQ